MRFPSVSFHFQPGHQRPEGGGKIIVAPPQRRSKRKPDLQPPLFFRRGKLSLPTGREATNRAPRPRWWLISVPGNESCHRELISPALQRDLAAKFEAPTRRRWKPASWQNYGARCFPISRKSILRTCFNFDQCVTNYFLYEKMKIKKVRKKVDS